MSLHPLFKKILEPLNPLKPHRFARQQMLENEIAMFCPTYDETIELLDALQCGMDVKANDTTPLEITHAFENLRKALYKAIKVDPDDCSSHHEQQARDE